MSNKVSEGRNYPFGEHIPRRQCIPILYTRGTHYDVGFDMVRGSIVSHIFPTMESSSVYNMY